MDGEFFVKEDNCPTTFQGYTLLLPSVSVGNVAQLALELLIGTMDMARVGWIDDPALFPVVGGDAFDHANKKSGTLHCAAEVFVSERDKLVVIQIRSPSAKNKGKGFLRRLINWIKQCQLDRVILLTSSHAHERRDIQLSGSMFRFLLTVKSVELFDKLCNELGWIPLEPRSASLDVLHGPGAVQNALNTDGVLDLQHVYLPGGGWAKHLYRESWSEKIQLLLIGMFCSQGDNTQDAVAMATHVNQLLCLHGTHKESMACETWTAPNYWNCLYGNARPSALY